MAAVEPQPVNAGPAPRSPRERIRDRVEQKLRPLTLPNFLTLLRMAMIPFIVLAIAERDFPLALAVFVLAGITDALDGWIARRFDAASVVGSYLDPLADKLLLTFVYVALTVDFGQEIRIPLWLTILTLFRDFLILLMAVVLYVVEGVRRFPPSLLGKATTFMLVVTVSVVLLANAMELPKLAPTACFYVSFGLVILSGFNYIYRSSRFIAAIQEEQARAAEDQSSL